MMNRCETCQRILWEGEVQQLQARVTHLASYQVGNQPLNLTDPLSVQQWAGTWSRLAVIVNDQLAQVHLRLAGLEDLREIEEAQALLDAPETCSNEAKRKAWARMKVHEWDRTHPEYQVALALKALFAQLRASLDDTRRAFQMMSLACESNRAAALWPV